MTLDELAALGSVQTDHPLSGMTTYKFGGAAAWYAEVDSMEHLDAVLAARTAQDVPVPIFILGRGSNVVVSDAGYPGLVIKLIGQFNQLALQGLIVSAGGGVSLPRLARFCANNGRGGLEFFVGIPGSVGGAVTMNAGGHGADTAAWLIDATVLDTERGVTVVDDAAALDLSYRHSRLGPSDIVLEARFRTVGRDPDEAEQLMREITAWRRANQPGGTFNAGSVFKNPPGDAAGRIIDAAGLKGHRCGGVSISERHANFFVADESATAQDVHDLVSEVKRTVLDTSGVDLQPEVRFIGDFGGVS